MALLARVRLGARSLSCWRNMIDACEFVVQLWALGTYYVDLADVTVQKEGPGAGGEGKDDTPR